MRLFHITKIMRLITFAVMTLLVVSCFRDSARANSGSLQAIPPKWKSIPDDLWWEGLLYMRLHDKAPFTIFVGQVVETVPNLKFGGLLSAPHNYFDVPVPLKVKLRVVKVIRGKLDKKFISVNNPDTSGPDHVRMNEPSTTLQRVRKGELYVLAYDPRTKLVDVNARDHCTQVYGLDDKLIKAFSLQSPWFTDQDPLHGMSEASKSVVNRTLPLHTRELAFHAMVTLLADGPISLRSTSMPYMQKSFLAIANEPNIDPSILMTGIQCAGIDHANPKGPTDLDNEVVGRLAAFMNSSSTNIANVASDSLYTCMVGTSMQNGRTTQYWYPEIIDALENRAAVDGSTGGQHGAQRALSNLKLVSRYPFSALQNNGAISVRHLKLKPAYAVAGRR